MKKAGIIGGIGPASTLDYYRGIVEGYRKRTGGDYPEIVIDSVDMNEIVHLVQSKDWEVLTEKLVCSVNNLANAGADFAAMSSNTLHIVFDDVEKGSPIPLISIVDETCRYTKAKGCKKVLMIGTLSMMRSGAYIKAFEEYGIAAAVPSDKDQEYIHSLFFPNLENGIVVQEDKKKMLAVLNRLIAEHNADALVLGCTELPLMIKDGDLDIPIINTTQIHIDSIVDFI